jgi:aryl sulfotransferase
LGSIVWLASYPKSGNTWLRALLINYLRDAEKPADINDLRDRRTAHAASRAMFDDVVGVEASALSRSMVERLRPEAYRRLAREADGSLVLKVHDAWQTGAGVELFPRDATRGVVYLVRNPLDVAVSWANHLGVAADEAVARMCAEDPVRLDSEVVTDHLPQLIGSWSDHVRSWLDASELPVLLVRYEDLHARAAEILAELAAFCGLEVDAARASKAVAYSSFGELRRQEREQGFRERPPAARDQFFRRGEIGGWRSELPATAASTLVAAHRQTMARLGYLNPPTAGEVSA